MQGTVSCARVYSLIRRGVGSESLRLGVGRNLYPLSAPLERLVERLVRGLIVSGRFSEYESESDRGDRELVARLLNLYLRRSDIAAEHVFFTNGAQEAISIVTAFGASSGLSALLPLPVYYSYEESAARHKMPVAGYYNNQDEIKWTGHSRSRLLRSVILPNAITGTIFPVRQGIPAHRATAFTLIDAIYQLGEIGSPGALGGIVRETLDDLDFSSTALIFTISKDLSLPGLRAGVLVTGSRELTKCAAADRFERAYSVNPLVGHLVALYLSILLLNDALHNGGEAFRSTFGLCRDAFASASIDFPDEPELLEIFAGFRSMAERSRGNLASVLASPALELDEDHVPFAGYSILPRIRRRFSSCWEFLDWVHLVGLKQSLKLNPAQMFGGSPDIWPVLYKYPYRLRINLGEGVPGFGLALSQLTGIASAAQPVDAARASRWFGCDGVRLSDGEPYAGPEPGP